MLFSFFVILLILDSIVLATAVLLQSGQGGGLAGLGGGASTDSFLGGRQATTVLTKASWWAGGLFLAFSVILAGLSTGGSAPRSVLEEQLQVPTPVSAPPIDLGTNPADVVSPGGAAVPDSSD